MRIGHLKTTLVEAKNSRGATYTRRAWRIVDDEGNDMIAPWQDSKSAVQELARRYDIKLTPIGITLMHVAVMLLLEEHHGKQWKKMLRRIWRGLDTPPGHLVQHLGLMMDLKASRYQDWLDRGHYRRNKDEKTPT